MGRNSVVDGAGRAGQTKRERRRAAKGPVYRKRRRVSWWSAIVAGTAAYLVIYAVYVNVRAQIGHGISRHGDLLAVDIKAMGDFDMDQANGVDGDIPKAYRDLDGKRVLLAGQMWVSDNAGDRVSQFDLCYSITQCCFSGSPRVQHFVKATVPDGKTAGYYSGDVKVIGTLHVGIKRFAGRVQSVYRLDVENVEPL